MKMCAHRRRGYERFRDEEMGRAQRFSWFMVMNGVAEDADLLEEVSYFKNHVLFYFVSAAEYHHSIKLTVCEIQILKNI